ncbi:MAG: hypothetical protein OEQ25_16770, partial [Gammaproteobacteria bacterium]|nr:hypothetical protein [Gammaproteobacteria bacterium]
MDNFLSRRLAQGATLVVDDRLAAIQLEAYLARAGGLLEAGAWRSADIQTYDDCCASLWATNFDRDRLLLNAAQSESLWRNVVAASPSGGGLIDTARIAAWAGEAWGLLHKWHLDYREIRARDDDPGFREFLSWAAQFEQALARSGWLDQSTLARHVAENLQTDSQLPNSVVWTDLRSSTPTQQTLSDRLSQAACEIGTWTPEPVTRSVYRVALENAEEELRQAVSWALRKMDDFRTARVALIVPMTTENELR